MKPYLGIKHPQLGSIAITGSHSLTLNLHILTELKHFHQNNHRYLFIQPHTLEWAAGLNHNNVVQSTLHSTAKEFTLGNF